MSARPPCRFLLVAVFTGGALGALARVISLQVLASTTPSGQALLLINGAGSLALGCLMGWADRHPDRNERHKALMCLLGVGFCGAFTTFSAVTSHSLRSLLSGQPWSAVGFLALQAVLCSTLAGLGFLVVRGGHRRG